MQKTILTCDRCGEEISSFSKVNNFYIHKSYQTYPGGYYESIGDFCHPCFEKLLSYLKGKSNV